MTPADRWRDVVAARISAEHMDALAPVRDRSGVRVHPAAAAAWVRWPAGSADVVRCLLPVPGVTFFTHLRGVWSMLGSRLPTSDVPPEGDGLPVAAVLVPGRFEAASPRREEIRPAVLGIVRGGEPRPASALVCSVEVLVRWADVATTAELAAVRAARCGGRAILLGPRLPSLAGAVRLWGTDVLVPVGFRPEPELPPATLREACGAEADELLVLDEARAEVVPKGAFEPLTRAGVRLGAAQS
ncbi:Uncharacterized protein OS=Singulisphaera acidiphila (strain ATCC BAA-1392 / DSM 18658 / VKM B-2454 / MOB10) GN=Sinac_2119 PE=4 SV=1 [Gemmataceae bacterium]|nr:Uncharacterized protein OS=Singulisphaera acidiphila (strain ATCC BAA-1392 / DSM 18658 / VKM B-2454 / MOB10) GN=Sinac_2119 PE=4 SV=1 [Gemmataceae bacterium]VTT96817.1 Uncharacterized protein OS=Singulisphaera acidiphila (strain ATCC BAA-1392 / DSM 18658 / VKM B-2454 / MOB10) GN=Sinac_2119 PE=4 SV=1 [Gemmataceae bacterium]